MIFFAVVGIANVGSAQSMLRVENADIQSTQKDPNGQTVQRLIGNVRILHDGTRMLCDNAYTYDQKRITATGNIRVIRDGVTLYGEQLVYDAATRQGVVTGKIVKLVDDSTELVTSSMKFDSKLNVAEYTTGGTITSPDGSLVSQYGYYYKANKKAVFKGNVVLTSDDKVIKTDSLMYLTGTSTAVFIAPTDVTTAKEHMKFNRGKFFRKSGLMTASGSVFMLDEQNREVLADSMEYYRDKGLAKLFNNVQVADSARKNYILGDYAMFNKKPETMLVTKNPVMVSISDQGDSIYLRADTLKSLITFSAKGDTIRNMIGCHHVRSYGKDFQSSCDSLFVSGADSTMHMYYSPLLWSDNTQISANEFKFITRKQQIYKAEFIGEPFIAQLVDTSNFNQVRGKEMAAFFVDNKITRLDAVGNGQTVYFMQDKDKIMAVNITESQNLSLYFGNSKIQKITFRSKPESRMVPLDKLVKEESQLKGLNWKGDSRPKSKNDITLRCIRVNTNVPDVKTVSQPKSKEEVKKGKTSKPNSNTAVKVVE